LIDDEKARNAGIKVEQDAPIASPGELVDYDAIIFGTPTRFGNMAAQMRNFLDQTGGLWMKGRWSEKWAAPSFPPASNTRARKPP